MRVPTGEIGPEGQVLTETLAEQLARGDAEIKKAQADAKGIEAAINCVLQNGAE